MNIYVLCVNCQSFRKTKYSSVFSEDTNIAYARCGGSVPAVEKALKKATGGWRSTDYIILDHALGRNSEKSFRKLFAGIIYRYEKTIQEDPRVTAKKLKKARKANKEMSEKIPEEDERLIHYNRKKTHIFSVEIQGLTGFAFKYAEKKILVLPKGLKADFIPEFIEKSQQLFDENIEAYPDGYSLTDKTYKILTFKEKYLPMKGDDIRECARKITQLTAAAVFVVAGLLLIYNMVYLPVKQAEDFKDLRYEVIETTSVEEGSEKAQVKKTINWKKLKKINKEIVGWIRVNETIDYPVLRHIGDNGDNQYYLFRNFKGESSGNGSIFVDYRSTKGLKSKNVILHGHHMDDGSMFASLKKYGEYYTGNLNYYKKHPTIEISTEKGGTEIYKIFSVFKSNVNPEQGEYFDFYCSDFDSDAQLMNYIYNLQIRSLITTPVTVNEDDQLLTLVTCSYEFDNFRTVVVARKCREGESNEVDVNKASIPPTSLWPQIYYTKFHSTRPTVSTFATEYEKGTIDWYDGKYKADGTEELPTSTLNTLPQFEIKVYNRGKLIKKFKVEEGSSFKLPKINTTYEEDGYKYTFKKWECKGSKSLDEITEDTVITAIYTKKKIPEKTTKATKSTKATKATKSTKATKATKPKSTKATKSTTKPTQAVPNKPADDPVAETTEPIEAEMEAE